MSCSKRRIRSEPRRSSFCGVARLDHALQVIAQLLVVEVLELDVAAVHLDVEVRQHVGRELGQVPVAGVRPWPGSGCRPGRRRSRSAMPSDVLAPFPAFEDGAAQRVDRLALLVHHVVVLEQVLADLEVVRLDLLLRALDRARDHARLDRLAFLHAQPLHQALDAVGAEDAHQVVFERQVEARATRDRPGGRSGRAAGCRCGATRGARCRGCAGRRRRATSSCSRGAALAEARPAPPSNRLAAPSSGSGLGARQELGVAAEQDVGAAAGHVGGDGDRALAAGLGDDRRLALVVLGVQHVVRDAAPS